MEKEKSDLNMDLENSKKISKEGEFVESLKEQMEFEDCLILNFKTARQILTDENLELLEYLTQGKPKSIQELSEELDRSEEKINQQIGSLYKHCVIDFSETDNNKKVELRHKNIAIKPIEF